MRVDVYTRHDAFIASVTGKQLLGFVHTDELNGSDSVEITTVLRLCEGYRLIWKDRLGKVHEHVCQDPKDMRSDSGVVYTDTALNSICELMGDYIDDKRPYGYSFRRALEVCLEPTRWQVGTVDQTGTVSDGLTFYHTDVRSALNAILECGGELETEISVDSSGSITRKVGIRQHRGDIGGHRRFEYGKDLTSISRTEHWGAITACYGYGKGLETESGGYGRKLTFGDINGGIDYVADSTALKTYGRPDGKGGFAHVFGKYENSQCEDAQQLKSETLTYLDAHKEPGVTYESDALDLVAMGRPWEGVGVGDDVQIVDSCFDPVLRCEGRVSKLVTDLLGATCKVTLGNVTETLSDIWERQQAQISGLQQNAANWDVAASTPGSFLQQIIDGLNEQFNTQGMSYCFTSFEAGTIWSSVPLDDQGRPTKTGGSAIQICSQGFRIASGTKADGSYDWRTFGTGQGFTADEITAGTLNAGLIKAGTIRDAKGKNFWELDTGEFSLSASATIGGETVQSIADAAADAAVDAQTQSDIFNKLTNNGATQGIYLSSGKVYINSTYIKTGILSDSAGRNSWNLATGDLTTNQMTANSITAKGTFECGSFYGIKLNSFGQLAGYRNGSQVGYIDYSSSMRDINTGAITYGIQMQCQGSLRISTPKTSMAATSDTSVTATYGYTGDNIFHYISKIQSNGDGTITWWNASSPINFINGFCTHCGFD